MTFSTTANVSIQLNKGDFYETRLPTGWLWFILLAFQTYNLRSKLATQTHQLHYPLQERHFPTPLRHAEKQQLHWNWTMLPLQSSSLQSPKFNVDNPTYLPGYSLWHFLEISRWTLKNSIRCAKKGLFLILMTASSGKPTPGLCFLPGRLRWTLFLKRSMAIHSVARRSNTQPSDWEAD